MRTDDEGLIMRMRMTKMTIMTRLTKKMMVVTMVMMKTKTRTMIISCDKGSVDKLKRM